MKTKAVRIHGKNDLRLEDFELPAIKDDEILAKVVSDSLCMSSYKAAKQGAAHKRVPDDVAQNPTILGHEFCGELVKVGKRWQDKFAAGDIFTIQPAFNYKGSLNSPGYSYRYIGGNATYVIIPPEAMIQDCLLKYDSDVYFYGSLAEPMSCIVGTFHAFYHTRQGEYIHDMGIVEGGNMAILAGVGPMGLGAIDYALHCDRRPGLLVVTDIDDERLARAASIYPVEHAAKQGVELHFVNTRDAGKEDEIMALTNGEGFNDVLVMAPVAPVVEQGDRLLAKDGCLNFFAGPTDNNFSAKLNFYNVHYAFTHVVGTSGGNTDDMRESIDMMSSGKINPATMITHIGGLDAVIDATLNLPHIPGGKKLIYTHISMPLTAISDFESLGKNDPFFAELGKRVADNGGFWCGEAEKYLLAHAKPIDKA
jgi:threonine dehydrogenase-like Zn-dependent dehydrogenase